ncbi:hypothetical protein BASA61_002283 [Batrachochytrium salamandrivorans]|nr:hypothetical protein BASA61_002283 [Batrachochytrium salamandrivorans]
MKMAGMGRAFRAFRAFRAEGLSGSTNRGLYRIHQFTKVELFALTRPTESMDISKAFIDISVIYSKSMNMPTEELGAPAHIKYDMEAWMPGRKPWGEYCMRGVSFADCRFWKRIKTRMEYSYTCQTSTVFPRRKRKDLPVGKTLQEIMADAVSK